MIWSISAHSKLCKPAAGQSCITVRHSALHQIRTVFVSLGDSVFSLPSRGDDPSVPGEVAPPDSPDAGLCPSSPIWCLAVLQNIVVAGCANGSIEVWESLPVGGMTPTYNCTQCYLFFIDSTSDIFVIYAQIYIVIM